jgi:hypothetical protein
LNLFPNVAPNGGRLNIQRLHGCVPTHVVSFILLPGAKLPRSAAQFRANSALLTSLRA